MELIEKKEEKEHPLLNKYMEERNVDKDYNVESWYDKLMLFTAQSFFIDISHEEACSIISFYRYLFLGDMNFTNKNIETLKLIQSKLDDLIKSNFSSGEYFFVRLSNRSPKDGESFNKNDLAKEYVKELQNLTTSSEMNISKDINEINNKIIASFKVTDKFTIKCKNSDEAMNLILTSERVYIDLLKEKICYEGSNRILKFEPKIVIRKWVDINSLKEFRCFVKNNKMTAISQYNHYVIIEELLNDDYLNKVKELLFTFWQTNIRDILIYLNDYVIDLAILKDESIYVIELNPFNTCTGGCMFLWDHDDAILNGKEIKDDSYSSSSVIIRCRTESYPNMESFQELLLDDLKNCKKTKNFKEVFKDFYKDKSENIKCFVY